MAKGWIIDREHRDEPRAYRRADGRVRWQATVRAPGGDIVAQVYGDTEDEVRERWMAVSRAVSE